MDLYEKQAGEKILRDNGIDFDQVDGVHHHDGQDVRVAYRKDFQDHNFNAGRLDWNTAYSDAVAENKKKAKGVPKDGSTINEDPPQERVNIAKDPQPSGRAHPAVMAESTEKAREDAEQEKQREEAAAKRDAKPAEKDKTTVKA